MVNQAGKRVAGGVVYARQELSLFEGRELMSTSIAEDLASHGDVVVRIDAAYRTVVTPFPDGRVAIRNTQSDFDSMPYAVREKAATQILGVWIEDVKVVLRRLQELNANAPSSRFNGKLDLQKIGIVRHSLGGATVAQFCHDDSQCKAGIDIDGIPFGSVVPGEPAELLR